MQKIIIGGIANPSFYWYGIVLHMLVWLLFCWTNERQHTFMKNIADRTVVQNGDLTQVRLHLRQVFDVRAIP